MKICDNDIKSYKGDIPDYWSDGAASSAFETAICRKVGELIVDGEILCALTKSLNNRWRYPKHCIDKAYKKLLFYNEHTWGASRGLRQIRPIDQKAQWATKSESALTSHELASSILELGAHALANLIENPGQT